MAGRDKPHCGRLKRAELPDVNINTGVDPLTTVTYSLSPVERSPRYPLAQFLSLYIHILSPPWFYVLNMYWFCNFTYSRPRVFFPPSHTARINLITPYARYYSAFSSVRLQQFYPQSVHIPYPHNHSIHYTIHSFSFTDTGTIVPLSTPSPSTPTSNSPHQPHWDPNTRDK